MTGKYANSLSKDIINAIKDVTLKFDIEEIHYKIKNGENIDEFSDAIVNLVDELTQIKQFKIQYKEQTIIWRPSNPTSTEAKNWNDNFNSIQSVVNSTFPTETKEDFVLKNADDYTIGDGIELHRLYNTATTNEIIINVIFGTVIDTKEKQSVNNILNELKTDTTDIASKLKELGEIIGLFRDDKKQGISYALKCFLEGAQKDDVTFTTQTQKSLRAMVNDESQKYVKCALEFVKLLGYEIRNSSGGIILDSKPDKENIKEIKSNFYHLLNAMYNSENNMLRRIYEAVSECFIFREKGIEDCTIEEMIDAIDDICDDSDKLNTYNQIFKAWFKRNNINGVKFVKYTRKDFVEEIVKGNKNKKLRGPSTQLFKKLQQYDFDYISNSNEIGLSMD
eukprot:24366_1